ncbi:MAG: sugar ABC transporter ATP-binding protein [Planctomycetaceae bacterium]|nr:sugar ABC transporter ATP-binding protein [Planctomycetaceae bacterium]
MTTSSGESYVLEMDKITKSFPGVKALDGMTLKVRPGTVHCLVGENGAGKSTLMKVLSGAYTIDEGRILFKGNDLHGQKTADTLELGISMIHQELSPVREMTLAENVFLGREPSPPGRSGRFFVHFRKMYHDTKELFDRIGLPYDPKAKMSTLSVAGMQQVEIAKAISRNASLILMDEPTSALTDKEVDMLFKQIRELRAAGVAIVYITHKMDEIFTIADDITVMRDGKWIASGPASDFDQEKIISLMVGRTITEVFPKIEVSIGSDILAVKNLCGKGFRDVSFSVREGEILGLAGLVGAGRTEVARALFGLDPYTAGEVFIDSKPVTIRTVRDAIAKGIAMVSEDRKQEGLVLMRSVRENTSLANLRQFAPGFFLDGKRESEVVADMIDLLRVKTTNMNTPVQNLSGGNQQKVVISKWIMGDLKVLILDEPTRGVDVGSKSEIHKLMCELASRKLAIIMISSELPEILGMSDRIIVMHEGKMRGILPRGEATQESIMNIATGASQRIA